MNDFYYLDFLPHWVPDLLPPVISSSLKGAFLLCFTSLLCIAFSRSPAMKHRLRSLSLCLSLFLPLIISTNVFNLPLLAVEMPLANFVNPVRQKPQPAADSNAPVVLISTNEFEVVNNPAAGPKNPAPAAATYNFFFGYDFLSICFILWGTGAAFFAIKLLIGYLGTGGLKRRASVLEDVSWDKLFTALHGEINLKRRVLLLQSEEVLVPVSCGILRPVVLLPKDAHQWTEEKRRVVLLHELGHIKRQDCLTQLIAQMACAFYWFNPIFWYAAHRLRIEREFACDDYVISLGERPFDYAQHLLDIANSAYRVIHDRAKSFPAIPMAEKFYLETRVRYLLNKTDGISAGSPRILISALSILCVFLFLAGLQPVTSANDEQNIISSDAAAEKAEDSAALYSSLQSGKIKNKSEAPADKLYSQISEQREESEKSSLQRNTSSPASVDITKAELSKAAGTGGFEAGENRLIKTVPAGKTGNERPLYSGSGSEVAQTSQQVYEEPAPRAAISPRPAPPPSPVKPNPPEEPLRAPGPFILK